MAGPKYVKDFAFPSDFGFTGSAGRVEVRAHSRQKYAKGGRVKRRSPLKPSPEQVLGGTIAAGAAAAAYDKLRDRDEKPKERLSVGETARGGVRERRERELGLKKGGKVSRRMKDC